MAGWGRVLQLLREAGVKPHALRINVDGSPQHPLYVGYEIAPKEMELSSQMEG